jgi:1,4-alpha-glucan branching enzyme
MKEVERRLNKIFNQTSNTEIRRRRMEKKLSKEAKPKTKNVQFNLYAPEAERVFLAGDFNNWDVDNLLMKKDKKGTWMASFPLPPGRYEYRFRVDGVWHDDPNAHERVGNPFGSQNCLRIVG